MTKLLALTFAATLAGISLTIPAAMPAETEDAAGLVDSAEAMESAAGPAAMPEIKPIFVYNSGVRDPFVPLVIPTPIPANELLAILLQNEATSDSEAESTDDEEVVVVLPEPTPTPVMLPRGINLECIIWSPQRQVAVIDGVFCDPGAVHRDVTVTAIHEKHVDVVYEGTRFELTMPNAVEELRRAAQSTVRMGAVN